VALLRSVVSPRRLGAAVGWNALVVALSSAAGPMLGSVILSATDWPGLFAVNLPLGLAVLLGSCALPASGGTAHRPDLVSMALNAASFAALFGGATRVPGRPGLGLALLAVAALGLAALVRRELPRVAPLVPFDLLRLHPFRMSVIASVCCFAGQSAAMVALPFHLQLAPGQTTFVTGLCLTAWPLAVAAMAPIAGRLAERVSATRLCTVGGVCLAVGLAAASLWPPQGGPLPLVACTVLCGLGFGLFNVPNNRILFLSAPSERSGAAGGAQGTARLLGQAAGALFMTLLFSHASTAAAPRIGLGLGAVLALLAGLVSALPSRGQHALRVGPRGGPVPLPRRHWRGERGEARHFLRSQCPFEHRDATDPAGEADAARTVEDAADGEGTAGAVIGGCVDRVVRIPPRIQADVG
jgi:DHA2 family multidrug resistance protein-like MFS transporter